jgi:hypothetical protein
MATGGDGCAPTEPAEDPVDNDLKYGHRSVGARITKMSSRTGCSVALVDLPG